MSVDEFFPLALRRRRKETLNETWQLAKSMQMRKFTTRVGAAGVCIKVVGANFTSTDKATFSLN